MLQNWEHSKIVTGARQTIRALDEGKVEAIIIADDVAPAIADGILEKCKSDNVQVTHVDTKKQLGKMAGIEVAASVVAKLR